MGENRLLSKEEVLSRLLAAAREGQDKQAETYLPTGYLQGLLAKTSPKPWEYQIITTVISGGQPLEEKYTHRICNEHGSLMEETGGWEMEGRDPDFELAALAPALAEEVIQSRETIAELKAQLAAVENPEPALEEEVIRLRGIIEDCEKSIAASTKAPERATRPEDVPPGEAWLVNVDDGERSGERVVALKHGRNNWRTADGAVAGSRLWFDEEVTLITPLVPVTSRVTTPAHPEYLETLEDYENAPVGTIVERPNAVVSGLYLIKLGALFYQSWKAPGLSGYCIDKDLAGTRRRVIYWPQEEGEEA